MTSLKKRSRCEEKSNLRVHFDEEPPIKKPLVVTYKMYTFMTSQISPYQFAYVCFFRLMPWTYSVFLDFLFEKLQDTHGFELEETDTQLPLLERNLARRVIAIIYYAEKMMQDNGTIDDIHQLFVDYLSDVINFDVDGDVLYDVLLTHQKFIMTRHDLVQAWFNHKKRDATHATHTPHTPESGMTVPPELVRATEEEYEKIYETCKII